MEIQTAETEDEGISSLPESILHQILSFLSQREAVRTCVLSKSWRYLGSTRPNFSLDDSNLRGGKEKFNHVLDKSLQVYYDQKLSIDDFNLSLSVDDPDDVVSRLKKWIPIVIHEIGVKKFHLSFDWGNRVDFDVLSAVFESGSLQELFLERCNLSQINSIIGNNNNHLKTLHLEDICFEEEETFAKIMWMCSLIEHLSLRCCEGFTTINMENHHNLKSFELFNYSSGPSIEIYLPSTIGRIIIDQCPNWFHHRNYFPGLTRLSLEDVPLSNEWFFNSFSRNFPCLEELRLWHCYGFDELKLSSPSIKKLDIWMDDSTTKKATTIDTPSIKEFRYKANISQSISFTTNSYSSEWNSHIHLLLDELDASLWFLKISEHVAAFSQSQINSLALYHSSDIENPDIEHLSDISSDVFSSGGSKKPVAVIKSLCLKLRGLPKEKE